MIRKHLGVLALTSALLLGSTSLARADPITTALFGAAFASSFFGTVVSLGITTALEAGASFLLGKLINKPASTASNIGSQLNLQIGSDTPLSFPLGNTATKGQPIYAGSWGNDGDTPNAYLTQVFALSDLPITGDPVVWVNDDRCAVTWSNTANAAGSPVIGYEGKLWVRFHRGDDTVVDPFLTAKFGADPDHPWLSDMIGKGVSYIVVTALLGKNSDNSSFWNGQPTFLFEIGSIALYDIRKDSTAGGSGSHRWGTPSTYEPSSNPMVQAYNVARGIYFGDEWVYGGQNWATFRLPAAVWMAAMNECDVSTAKADGTHEPQFSAGGMVGCDVRATDLLTSLLDASSGRIAAVGGVLKPLIGVPVSAVYSITDADLLVTEQIGFAPFPGLDQTQNSVVSTYTEPAEMFGTKPAPPLYDASYIAADDNRQLIATIDRPLVQSNTQAQRLDNAALTDARRFRQHEFFLGPYAWLLEPLDAIDWSSEENGYDAKLFLLTGITGRYDLMQNVSIKEVDPSDGSWNPATQEQAHSVGELGTTPPSPQPMTGWGVAPWEVVDPDGASRRPGILISAAAHLADVQAVQVQVRESWGDKNVVFDNPAPYNPLDDNPTWSIGSMLIVPAKVYEVRGRYIPEPGSPRGTLWSNETLDGDGNIVEGDWFSVTIPDVRFTDTDISVSFNSLNAVQKAKEAWLQQQLQDLQTQIQRLADGMGQQDIANVADKQELKTELVARTGNVVAGYTQQITVEASAREALAVEVTALTATVGDNSSGLVSEVNANSTDIDAQATSIQQLFSSQGGNSAQVNIAWATAAAHTGYAASYVVQAMVNDGTPRVAALGIDVPASPTGKTLVWVRGGQFAIYKADGTGLVVFDEDGLFASANGAIRMDMDTGDFDFGT